MKLFDIVPGNFFGLLTRSNKELYAEALMVLVELFQKSRIFIDRDELFGELSSKLRDMVYDMEEEEDEEIGDQFSGRINYIIRQLEDFGWIEKDDAFNQKKLVIPGYALRTLQAIDEIVNLKPQHYNSLVFGTFSALLTADTQGENHFEALSTAHKNTVELQNNLKSLLMNMKQYHKMLMRQTETRKILEHHFDSYAEAIDIGQLHPLKTIDSIPRFKDKIIGIIEKWEVDVEICSILTEEIQKVNGGGEEAAKQTVLQMMNEIVDIYIGIDEITKEIDVKHKDYIRASQERIKALLHADKSIKGLLVSVLDMLPQLRPGNSRDREIEELLAGDLPLFSVETISDTSLFVERSRKERGNEEPVKIDSLSAREAAERMAREMLATAEYERTLVDSNSFVKGVLGERTSIMAREVNIRTREEFIKLLFAIVNEYLPDAEYSFCFQDQLVWAGNAKIQDFILSRKNVGRKSEGREAEVA
jgi:hypothetical protein